MNHSQAIEVLGYIQQLWSGWEPTPDLQAVWLAVLMRCDDGDTRLALQWVREDSQYNKPSIRAFKAKIKTIRRPRHGKPLAPPRHPFVAVRDLDGRRRTIATRGDPRGQQEAAQATVDQIAAMYGGEWRLEVFFDEPALSGPESRFAPPEVQTAQRSWVDRDAELYETMMLDAIEQHVVDPQKRAACLAALPGQVEWLRKQKPRKVADATNTA